MPRCACGAGTCSCNVDAENSVGIDIGGDGSSTNPWTFSVDRDTIDLAGVISFQNTDTVEFSQQGDGSQVSPLTVFADAKVSMAELTDGLLGDTPNTGEVPTWSVDHWEWKPLPSGPQTSVFVQDPISGDGTTGSRLGLKTSGTWPLTGYPSAQAGTTGDEIFVDSNGQVRGKPGIITVAKPATDLPPTYPTGPTVMSVDATTGAAYPAAGACTVVTERRVEGAATQWCSSSTGGTATAVWVRTGSTTAWAPWVQIAGPTLPAPVTMYQNTDVPAGTSRHVEGSPSTRVQITNPHPTRSMLVQSSISCWIGVSGYSAAGDAYIDVDALSGASVPVDIGSTVAEQRYAVTVNGTWSANFSNEWVVPASTTGIWYASAAKVGGTFTLAMRSTRIRIVPLRYL